MNTRLWRILMVLAITGLYIPTLVGIARVWSTDTYAGHGMFVPLFSTLVAWIDRDRIRAASGSGQSAGLIWIVAGIAILVLGHTAGSLLLRGLSIPLVVAGLLVWNFGIEFLRSAAFPVWFLALMVPLPRAVADAVTLDLQLFAARFAGAGLRLIDIPVYQTGVLIELPVMTLQVAEICNGLRFLMALIVLTAAFAQVTQPSILRKIALVASAVPIAIFANAARVAAIALAVHFVGPEAASGTIHNWIGKGVWGLTLIPLILLGLLLARGGVPKVSSLKERAA